MAISTKLTQKKALLIIILIFFATTLPAVFRPFSSRGEPREALVPQQILRSGEWVLPRRYGDMIPTKPPMTHWMVAIISAPMGHVTEFAARAPSYFLSLLSVVTLFHFLFRRYGVNLALLTSILLVTSAEWFRSSVTARVDMALSVFIFIALLSGYRWWERGLKGMPILCWIFLSLAALTKGPVALLLPGMSFFAFLIFSRINTYRAIYTTIIFILPSFILPLIWYFAAFDKGGQDFLDVVINENFRRFSGTMDDDPHSHSALYLYSTLLLGFMPWTIFLVFPILLKPKLYWENLKGTESYNFLKFCVIVSVSFLIFYSIPSSKRSVYLLPVYPFISVILTQIFLFNRHLLSATFNRFVYWFCIATIGVLVLINSIPIFPAGVEKFLNRPKDLAMFRVFNEIIKNNIFAGRLIPIVLLVTVIFLALTTIYVIRISKNNKGQEVWASIPFMCLFVVGTYIYAAVSFIHPLAVKLSPKTFAEVSREIISQNSKILSIDNQLYGYNFYLDGAIAAFPKNADNIPESFYLISKSGQEIPFKLNKKLIADSNYYIEEPGKTLQLWQVE